jgi:four helix bundle protein
MTPAGAQICRSPAGSLSAEFQTMNPETDALKRRTKQFALDVLRFARGLPVTEDARIIGRQLIRSGTGVASGYRSACRSRSRAEFIARVGVVLDEADESALWLEILDESAVCRTHETRRLIKESNELIAIFAQSSITAKSRVDR